MGIPHEFLAGEVARAQEVNENFAYIMSILGQLTTPDRVKTTTEFQMGARQNVLMTGTHDTGPTDLDFFQIGWNADWNLSGTWKFARFISGERAVALRLGADGLEVYGTSETTGSLNATMERVFAINISDATYHWVYIPRSWSIQNTNTVPDSIQDYRLTYTAFESPPSIYNDIAVGKGTTIFKSSDYGVPSYAKIIEIQGYVTAGSTATAGVFLHTEQTTRTYRKGFSIHAAPSQKASGSGKVPLGEGSYAGKFVIERTNPLSSASLFIAGYYS